MGYSTVYHERALNNYFIPCNRKYSGQHNQYDVHAAHDEKVGCNIAYYNMLKQCITLKRALIGKSNSEYPMLFASEQLGKKWRPGRDK